MKKLKLDQQKFAGAEVLSRAQLKKVMGGNGSGGNGMGTCSITKNCSSSLTISCSSSKGICDSGNATQTENGWIQCDSDPKIYCK